MASFRVMQINTTRNWYNAFVQNLTDDIIYKGLLDTHLVPYATLDAVGGCSASFEGLEQKG